MRGDEHQPSRQAETPTSATGNGASPQPAARTPDDITSVTANLAQQLSSAVSIEQRRQAPEAMPRAEATGAPAAKPPQPQPRREQWSLGDLLARASEPETEQMAPVTQPPPPEFLRRPVQGQVAPPQERSASEIRLIDLASAVDDRMAAEVWLRFRRGERDILNRRLYTPQGQTAFDEISTRYGRDPDFQSTVDRYMGDFERLLKEAETRDKDGRLLQNYLTSETGRVYLMLAHASGRFG